MDLQLHSTGAGLLTNKSLLLDAAAHGIGSDATQLKKHLHPPSYPPAAFFSTLTKECPTSPELMPKADLCDCLTVCLTAHFDSGRWVSGCGDDIDVGPVSGCGADAALVLRVGSDLGWKTLSQHAEPAACLLNT